MDSIASVQIETSERVRQIAPSGTRAVSDKVDRLRAEGVDVINFSGGEPDGQAGENVKEAAIEAIRQGKTRYTATAGIAPLKAAFRDKLKRELGLSYTDGEVIASAGGKHSLINAFLSTVNPGDEVVIPLPYWVSFPEQVKLCGGVPVFVNTTDADGFQLKADALRAVLTPKTRVILLNSPNNPTGAVYTEDTLREIGKVVVEHNLIVISDECYDAMVFDGARHISIASISDELKARTLVVQSVSKAHAMTGWRIGLTAGPAHVVAAMTKLQSQMTSCPTAVSQVAAAEALSGSQSYVHNAIAEYQQRRDVLVFGLNAIDGIRCRNPVGTFYVFPNVSGLFGKRHGQQIVNSSRELASYLIDEAKVAVIPGAEFGAPEHIRMDSGMTKARIVEGLARIREAIAKLDG